VAAPRVNDKQGGEATGERRRFSSAVLPPWCRWSAKFSQALLLLCLHGLSTGDFALTLRQFPGGSAVLSTVTVTRLTRQWTDHCTALQDRDLSGVDCVQLRSDGAHLRLHLAEGKACMGPGTLVFGDYRRVQYHATYTAAAHPPRPTHRRQRGPLEAWAGTGRNVWEDRTKEDAECGCCCLHTGRVAMSNRWWHSR
jgi:hypothetical protein